MSRCRGPHWFAYYGAVGSSSPTCVRLGCDAPNPRYNRHADHLATTPIPEDD
jgi:hypothetical protein